MRQRAAPAPPRLIRVTDLRDFSGALRWWHGCATLLGLCGAAWTLAPPRPALHSSAVARETGPAATAVADNVIPAIVPLPSAAPNPGMLGLEGRVGSDLARAIDATGAWPQVAVNYTALLRRHGVAIDHLGREDVFRIVIETDRAGNQRLVYAELLRRGQPPLRMLAGGETPRLGAPAPLTRGVAAYRLPVFGRITSAFGNRLHPILGYMRPHRGVDIGAPAGTPIKVAAAGRVMSAGWSGGYGNLVRVRHTDGLISSYAHMSAISVSTGSNVTAGQTIGRVGWTGLATGPHLHFELSRNGVALDPTRSRPAIMIAVPSKALEQRYRRLRSWPMFHSISDASARTSRAMTTS